MIRRLVLLMLGACSPSCTPEPDQSDNGEADPPEPVEIRVASYNTSLFQELPGRLAQRLADPAWEPAQRVAAVVQRVRPDVILLNEVDTDLSGEVADLLRQNFLAVAQNGGEPLDYAHAYVAPVNTGVHTGLDVNRDGRVIEDPGSSAYAEDSHGYGTFEGQYGMLVLSRYPIASARTFQTLRWADMPEPGFPDDPETGEEGGWYTPEVREILRLSSKSHWDLTLDVGGHPLHLLASHPTPPAFHGPERRNAYRNNAEVRFWIDYLTAGDDGWMVDDDGQRGGLGDGPFVLVGDLNADPNDGAVAGGAITSLVAHARVHQGPAPASEGAVASSQRLGGVNRRHIGDAAHDTAEWNPETTGNLRVDYALPSADVTVVGSGVFWPLEGEPEAAWIDVSDHRAVWVDVRLEAGG